MAHEYPNVPGAHDRTPAHQNVDRAVHRAGVFNQAAEMNELESRSKNRDRRIGNLSARNGDRVSGTEAVVKQAANEVILTAGELYIEGDVRPIAEKEITGVAMIGEVVLGAWMTTSHLNAADNADFYGLEPGSRAEGEEGAVREVKTLSWGLSTDTVADGTFYAVYRMTNGTVIDQTPPPALSGINQAIGLYDRDVNGSYIVDGNYVTALGKTGSDQVFSISEGVANIFGFKRTRYAALRYSQLEEFDVSRVTQEAHTYVDNASGSFQLTLNQSPLAAVITATVTKLVTAETINRSVGSNDSLNNTGILTLVEVKQGATVFVESTDYQKTGDEIEWLNGGNAPASSSSYDVTYHYTAPVQVTSQDHYTVTLPDGVVGEPCSITYDFKLSRTDIICLDYLGDIAYIKGISTRGTPHAQLPPTHLLKLCEVENTWVGAPIINNNGTRALIQDDIRKMRELLIDNMNLIGLERLRRDIDVRELAGKKGRFVDPFTSDRYRDAGIPQTAAVFEGSCQLPIKETVMFGGLQAPAFLDYTEEIIIDQPLATGCEKINPYANFEPLPGELIMDPSVDFWTERRTEWASAITRSFGSGNRSRTSTRTVQLEDDREELIEFLRPISIAYTIKGFGGGEIMKSFDFDGISILPDPAPVADANGDLSGTFTIPENVTAGTKAVTAEGMGGTVASARFTGQGVLLIDVFRRVTTINRWTPPRPRNTGFADPQAQSFALTEERHIVGANVKFCNIGDPTNGVICELVTVENGDPTTEVIAQAFLPMTNITLNAWTEIRFPMPVYTPADRDFAFVFKTDDNEHSLAIATIGDFDATAQQFVTAQPYTVGVRSSSSNARAWTHHNDSDLAIQVVAAVFDPVTKIIPLGTHDVVKMSDILVRAGVDIPTEDARVYFEIVRSDNTTIYTVNAFEALEIPEYITEQVTLRAVLTGTDKISPIIYPGVQFIPGELQTEGTYAGRVYGMGNPVETIVWLKTKLPGSSTLKVEVDAANQTFVSVPRIATEPIEDNWREDEYRLTGHNAPDGGRIKLTLTGAPDARPSAADLRTASI